MHEKWEMDVQRMFLILLLVSFFGAGSIGIVWLRMDISRVAKKCGQLETDREVVSRELYELRGQKSRSLRPSTLAAMVSGRLEMPGPENTFHISELDMKRRLQMTTGGGSYRGSGSDNLFVGTR